MNDRPMCMCRQRPAVWVEATFSGLPRAPRGLCHECAFEYAAGDRKCTLRVIPYVIDEMEKASRERHKAK
jgi:hypothetical protein